METKDKKTGIDPVVVVRQIVKEVRQEGGGPIGALQGGTNFAKWLERNGKVDDKGQIYVPLEKEGSSSSSSTT